MRARGASPKARGPGFGAGGVSGGSGRADWLSRGISICIRASGEDPGKEAPEEAEPPGKEGSKPFGGAPFVQVPPEGPLWKLEPPEVPEGEPKPFGEEPFVQVPPEGPF